MIYIVEDDVSILELEQYALQNSGYEVVGFGAAEPFWDAVQKRVPDLVILDVMLPGEDGYSILKKLRSGFATRRTAVIMVTAKSSELDTVKGLDYGADDYIAKPFGIMEFISRVRAALRRAVPAEDRKLCCGPIVLDDARRSVAVSDKPIELTYKEYSLLKLLLERQGTVVSRDMIMRTVWETDVSVESRTIDMHIRTLRQKLGEAAEYLRTVRKVGYMLSEHLEERE